MKRAYFFLFLFFSLITRAQVHLQTGTSFYNVPLLAYSDPGNRLSASVSLAYKSGGGILANSISSCVGTGWELNAGGFIARTVIGQPDDQKYVSAGGGIDYFSSYPQLNPGDHPSYYPDGYLFTPYTANDNLTKYSTYVPIANNVTILFGKSKYDLADREQDIFTYNFNGRVGSFVIGKDWVVNAIEDSKLKFQIVEEDMSSDGIRTRIKLFKVTDEQGIEYTFSQKEVNEVYKYNSNGNDLYPLQSSLIGNYKVFRPWNRGDIYKVVSRWFITSVRNPLTGKEILYDYDDEYYDYVGPKHTTRTSLSTFRYQFMVENVKVLSKRLKEIKLNSNERFLFTYKNIQRADLPGGYALESVSHTAGGIATKKFNFEVKYFFNNELKNYDYSFSAIDRWKSRLALTKISEVGKDNSIVDNSSFEYYLSDPNLSSVICPQFSINVDDWGYYKNSYSYLEGADGCPLPGSYEVAGYGYINYAQHLGLLKKVKNIYGGFQQFYYEQNGPYLGGTRVSKVEKSDGDQSIFTEYKYVNSDGTSSRWGDEAAVYYEDRVYRQYKISGSNLKSGLSAHQVASSFSSSAIFSTISYIGSTAKVSYGASVGNLIGGIILGFVVGEIIDAIIFEFQPDYQDQTIRHWYTDNIKGANRIYGQYKRVEVHEKGSGTANVGKTIYEFTSSSDPGLDLFVSSYNAPYSMKPRMAPWYYGLPKKVSIIDAGNVKVSEEEFSYDFFSSEYQNENNKSAKYWSNMVVSAPLADSYNEFGSDPILKEMYYPIHGRSELKEKKNRTYVSGGAYQEVVTKYYYNPVNHQLSKTEVEKGNGISEGSNIYYTVDYEIPGLMATMKSPSGYNMVNVPVSSSSWVKSSNGNKYLKDLTVHLFSQIQNQDIKSTQTFRLQSEFPILTNDFITALPTTNLTGFSYLNAESSTNYSLSGLPVTTNTSGSRRGYYYSPVNMNLVIAEASNASGNEIFYDSFEDDNTWNGISLDNSRYHLGKRSGKISNTNAGISEVVWHSLKTLSIQNTAAKKYKYSTWYYSNGPEAEIILFMKTSSETGYFTQVSGKTSSVLNKWVYLEGEVEVPANITQLNIRIDNNGMGDIWFDDVRIQPSNSSMITYTYDPFVGKTSECDDMNNKVFYFYDSFGRLDIVRDAKGNILKKYCYTISGQTESCKLYYNSQKSQTFTRNNCGSGYEGASYTYTVPANAHVGSTQYLADQAALNDIAQNGQAEANSKAQCLLLYYSAAIAQNFTRTTCSEGYTPVPYYVQLPAGQFTSTVSQAAANLLAQNYAQAQANSLGSCTPPVGAQVYARLEIEASSFTDNSSGNYTDYAQLASVFLRFYSDINCTVPLMIPQNYNFELNAQGYFETQEGITYYDFPMSTSTNTISSGETGLLLDDVYGYYGFMGEYDDVLGWLFFEKWKDDYYLTPSSQYIIRPTVRTINYPNGF